MCGVFGIVFENDRKDLGEILIKASRKLVYRGYDSAGFASFDKQGKTKLSKGPGKLEDVIQQFDIQTFSGSKGIVQLRWATFGEPNAVNSQPHFDSDGDIIGAHNGNIVNTSQLIEQFKKEGMTVRGENDGEMVVHAYEKFYNQNPDPVDAMRKAQTILKGDYAFIVGNIENKNLLSVKMGSSLYMGVGDDFICCSSDLASILQFTNRILFLNDGEMVYFGHNHYQIYDIKAGSRIERKPEISTINVEQANLEGFPHFMLKEIHEQPTKTKELFDLLENSSDLMKKSSQFLRASDRIFLVASGTSYHASVIGSYFLNNLAGLNTQTILAGQFNNYYGTQVKKDDLIFCVSQSGETKDVVNVINPIRDNKACPIMSMVNIVGSSIALKSDLVLNISAGLETSVPATKTFMNQIFLFLYLAIFIGKENSNEQAEELYQKLPTLSNLLKKTIETTTLDAEQIANSLVEKATDLYCLGYGINFGAALEGSLKIKEVYYKHCEGMYSSEFKHGPLSIVEAGYPILFPSSLNDAGMVISHINEIMVRKGYVVVISPFHDAYKKSASQIITVPDCDHYFTPFLNIVVLQLIAYFASVHSGYDPDFPRNISKTLTVD